MSPQIAKHELISNSQTASSASSFLGYTRSDGRVGTANFWLVVPTVFCENRNLDVIKEALLYQLGYQNSNPYAAYANQLAQSYKQGIQLNANEAVSETDFAVAPVFNNVTGVKFLNHTGGCGGTRQDADALARLLAAYINHPNVGGVSIISLGCQNLQTQQLLQYVKTANPSFNKPLHIIEQQQAASEQQLITLAINQIIQGLEQINQCVPIHTPFSQLCIGIQTDTPLVSKTDANNVQKIISQLVASECKVLMAQNDSNIALQMVKSQLQHPKLISKFDQLLHLYQSAFASNLSQYEPNQRFVPWGAAADVLDYAETAIHLGLNWMFTPPNKAISQTALVAGGATILVRVGGNANTDIHNPICPLVQLHNQPFKGIRLEKKIVNCLYEYWLLNTNSASLEQFLPWKRGVSL